MLPFIHQYNWDYTVLVNKLLRPNHINPLISKSFKSGHKNKLLKVFLRSFYLLRVIGRKSYRLKSKTDHFKIIISALMSFNPTVTRRVKTRRDRKKRVKYTKLYTLFKHKRRLALFRWLALHLNHVKLRGLQVRFLFILIDCGFFSSGNLLNLTQEYCLKGEKLKKKPHTPGKQLKSNYYLGDLEDVI